MDHIISMHLTKRKGYSSRQKTSLWRDSQKMVPIRKAADKGEGKDDVLEEICSSRFPPIVAVYFCHHLIRSGFYCFKS